MHWCPIALSTNWTGGNSESHRQPCYYVTCKMQDTVWIGSHRFWGLHFHQFVTIMTMWKKTCSDVCGLGLHNCGGSLNLTGWQVPRTHRDHPTWPINPSFCYWSSYKHINIHGKGSCSLWFSFKQWQNWRICWVKLVAAVCPQFGCAHPLVDILPCYHANPDASFQFTSRFSMLLFRAPE